MSRLGLTLVLALAAPTTSWAQAPPGYVVQDLGTLGGSDSIASDLNNAGWVVGTSGVAETHRAFLWLPGPALGLDGGIHDLGALADGDFSEGRAIDAGGRVVGRATREPVPGTLGPRAFLWQEGTMTDLGTLEPWRSSAASGINERGDIVGYVSFLECRPTVWLPEARYGLPAGINELPLPAGWFEGRAFDINNRGQVVGVATTSCYGWTRGHPYLWLPAPAFGLPAGAHDLSPQAPTQGFGSAVAAINDLGEMVGYRTEDAEVIEPLIWRDGVAAPLPLPPGVQAAFAHHLNDRGQVVGSAGSPVVNAPFRALLWQDGQVYDLNDLIPEGSGWILEYASAINRRGQIAGWGDHNGERRAFLLTPTGVALEIPALGIGGAAVLALLLAGAGAALIGRRNPQPDSR